MKTKTLILGIASVLLLAIVCCPTAQARKQKQRQSKKQAQKVLVVYYSQTSNTKAVAEEIAKKLGADIAEVEALNPYDGDFKATIDRCQQERKDGIVPEIKALKVDLKKYDVIFLGYPVWFGTYAPPIASFLDKVDLSGKKIVPFCTFGSGGLESSVDQMKSKQPKAEILDGYGVRAARMKAMPAEVDQFLKASGFLKGEHVKLGEFSIPHVVSDDEAAIFNAAIGDYPMLKNVRALTVASRPIPNGVEYLFTASDKPRNPNSGNQEPRPWPLEKSDNTKDTVMRPPVEMQVYVVVINGETPVFTRVVR